MCCGLTYSLNRNVLSLYHTEPTVITVRPVWSVLRSLRWLDRTKFFLKSKKTRTVYTVSTVTLPVSLLSTQSPDRRNRMGSVIQSLHVLYTLL